MQIARDFSTLQRSSDPVALTIGSFDGVHAGHKYLFSQMATLAPTRLVTTFETLPINYFRPELNIPQLTTLEEKLTLLEQAGVDLVLLLPFNKEIATLTYKEFLQKIYHHCPFNHLVLGKGAAFGKDAQGNEENIRIFSEQLHFTPHYIEKFLVDGRPLSSRRLREEKFN
ncbi:MAG: FAD synthetase family protein [Candidatus Algichlamydia australiensis]|nr:FAD synthetase family protein [Chlamydiales bacterium]